MMEDEDDSINSSPTPKRKQSSRRSIHGRQRDTTFSLEKQTTCETPLKYEAPPDFEELEEELLEADHLDCLRAQEEQPRVHGVPASNRFQSLEFLLESQQLPAEEIPNPWQQMDCACVAQEILRDFCGSPSYTEELSPCTSPAYYNFLDKPIRTYERRKPDLIIEFEDEEIMSCSSGLSVEEVHPTQIPKTKHCQFDANSSQKICENLLNLSAFFTQSSSRSIDLPAGIKQEEEDEEGEEDLLQANDSKRDQSVFMRCDKGLCDCVENSQAIKEKEEDLANPEVDFCEDDWFIQDVNTQTLFASTVTFTAKEEVKVPLREGQLKDNPTETDNMTVEHLEEIPLSEWQPLEIEATEQQLDQAAKTADAIEFRTASNKTLKLSEEMRRRASMLMVDLECPAPQTQTEMDQLQPAATSLIDLKEEQLLDEIPLSEWQPMDIPGNSVPVKKCLSEDMNMMAFSEWQPLDDIPDTKDDLEFRTASNKIVELSEEMRQRAAALMADLEVTNEKPQQVSQDNPQLSNLPEEIIGFRSASNKAIEVTENMRRRAAMLMADLDVERESTELPKESTADEEEPMPIKETEVTVQIKEEREFETKPQLSLQKVTPQTGISSSKSCLNDMALETPKCTPELQTSLTQLSERSPLDKVTKSSIIARRNLLSLNKRRKLKRDAENVNAGQKPKQQQCQDSTPMAMATSTPVPGSSKENPLVRYRRRTQGTPLAVRERVGKRRSEEALSPIYAPTIKTRRLGLSRIRNKSSNEI